MSIVSSRRLLILACSATKRDGPAYMPALDRYDGPLWRTLRTVRPNGANARVAFLLAHLGLRASDTPIETYDARMTKAVAAAMKAGGLGTRWPRPRTQASVMPAGDHPGEHIARLTDFGRSPFAEVALVGGRLYLDVLRHFIGLFREDGYVTTDVRVTEINGPIGYMRRDLRLWLNGGGRGCDAACLRIRQRS